MKERFEAREMPGCLGLYGVWDNINEEWFWDWFTKMFWRTCDYRTADLKAWELNNKRKRGTKQ